MSEKPGSAPPEEESDPSGKRTLEVATTAGRLLQNWGEAYRRALAYLEELGVPANERAGLAEEAVGRALAEPWPEPSDSISETLRATRALLLERYPSSVPGAADGSAEDPFLRWRLERALEHGLTADQAPSGPSAAPAPPWEQGRLCSMPRLDRFSMTPETIERRPLVRLARRLFGRRGANGPNGRTAAPAARPLVGKSLRRLRRSMPWTRAALRRRFLLILLVLIPTIVASGSMANILHAQDRTWVWIPTVVVFGALFGWISIGFWTALMGFFTLIRRRDRFAITRLKELQPVEIDGKARTAIVMPICGEPVERVFAGLRAIRRSLESSGLIEPFHFFVLSDTQDPGLAVQEEAAWFEWCRDAHGFGSIFYRRRKVRVARKSGNIADFLRRWGKLYRYMIVLDADSLMSGETVTRLVQLMEAHPQVGMVQTAPSAVNRDSLLARVQQFSTRAYGPMFAAGLHAWQLGDGQFWGHNAIIRVEPFMAHCGLPKLPGKEPFGGEILSHDFVESALMGRAGWTMWLAYDLGGSYEEIPSTLLEEMKRDRRWCQGNLQHLRLLFSEGLFGAHRMLFLNGALSYVSALLWFLFLTLSTAEAIRFAITPPQYFPEGPVLFPQWPVWRPLWAISLVAVIGLLLFLPKTLAALLIVFKHRNARAFGGVLRLLLSIVLEILLSSLLAPIRMVFHSRFVVTNLLGRTVTWRASDREGKPTGWREAFRSHAADSLLASAWGGALFWLNPNYFWWVTPIVSALILSIPLSVFTSRSSAGQRARRWGLFLIPEESQPPPLLQEFRELHADAKRRSAALPERERDGFVRAAVNPLVNALHRALLGRPRRVMGSIRERRRAWLERLSREGPAALGMQERRALLLDPECTDGLHERLWSVPEREAAILWGGTSPRPAAAPRKDPESPGHPPVQG
ncbi:MAG: glucans biosynthesis glucosyltransferase MdoH [bacterium]